MKNVDMRILTLHYWQEPKYKNILTNNIFKRTYEEIIEILEIPYWEDKRFDSLLSSSIFMKNASQISESIEYCFENGLGNHINKTLIYNNSYKELVSKTNFLNDKMIPLYNGDKLNSIYSSSNNILKEKYDIDRNDLINKYYYNKGDKYVLR